MPESDETPPINVEQLKEIERLMQNHDISQAAGLVLAAWRLYWLARANLIAISGGKITEEMFPVVSQALARSACMGFKIGRFKNDVKNTVMPFLRKLAAREAKMGIPHGPRPKHEADPRATGGDETPSES